MNIAINPAPVRKEVLVKAPQQRAFDVFTGQMTRWWRPDHHLGSSPLKEVVLEPRANGRWYEVCEDGTTCEWGKVIAWEPPGKVVLAWQLTADWKYDPQFVTELEIRFVPADGGTRVTLEHRNLDRFGERAAATRAALDSAEGWTGGLVAFARAVDGTP
jgi:uncharacterized protein YndB with AHSA1/START domain